MSESGVFLDYHGPVDYDVLDSLLIKLREKSEFKVLNKTTCKRVYSVVVECLETSVNMLNLHYRIILK